MSARTSSTRPKVPWVVAGVVLLVAGLAIGLGGGREAAARIPALVAWVEGAGAAAPLLFVVGYAVGTVLLVPGSFMTLAAGAVFGVFQGTMLVAAGATLGMMLAFLLSRRLARGLVQRRLAATPRLEVLDRAVGADGLRIVLLLRLSPLFPFALLNYLLGLTQVRFRDYLLGSLGIIPWTIAYAWAGALAGDLAAISAGTAAPPSGVRVALLAVGGLATVVLALVIGRQARRALTQVAPDLAT